MRVRDGVGHVRRARLGHEIDEPARRRAGIDVDEVLRADKVGGVAGDARLLVKVEGVLLGDGLIGRHDVAGDGGCPTVHLHDAPGLRKAKQVPADGGLRGAEGTHELGHGGGTARVYDADNPLQAILCEHSASQRHGGRLDPSSDAAKQS